MYYCGIDLSTTNSGIVIIDDEENVEYYELISPNKSLDIYQRSVEVIRRVCEVVQKYEIRCVAIESGALFGKGRRNELAMLNGAVFYTLLLLDYSVKLLPPSSLKKFATGNGRASKEEIRKATPSLFIQEVEGVVKKSDDIFDAYWLAKYAKTIHK